LPSRKSPTIEPTKAPIAPESPLQIVTAGGPITDPAEA
jgi:hypothetical protein